MTDFCNYYQAYLSRPHVVQMIGILKSFEHICFDRTLNPQTSLFEFFVPRDQEYLFLKVMDYFQAQGIVTQLQKMDNRLIHQNVL